ncbi:MAG TPA: hypothetical protein VIF15_15595 [Polyangiaceae bacterium]
MTVLTKRTEWRLDRPANQTRRSTDLTPEEQANVRRALHVLRRRLGGYHELAKAIRVPATTLQKHGSKKAPSAAVALRLSRLAGVAVEEMLTGRWPVEGACPHCGRG